VNVKINIFYPRLQEFIGNLKSVEVEGITVGECLHHFMQSYPGVERFIFDESKKYLRHVFIYVNAESASKAQLDHPVKSGDEILVAVLVTGG
jgi:molybdopterin converting factor small subunit